MKKTIIAAAAIVAMVGCNKNLIEVSNPETEYGYINLGVSADTDMVVAKAASDYNKDTFNVTVTNTETQNSQTKEFAEAKDGWKVAKGPYEVYAENLSVAETYTDATGKGVLRVAGTTTVTVESGLSASCVVNCTPANSKVSFLYTEAFKTLFGESNTVTVSNTAADSYPARNVVMNITEAVAEAEAAFFEADVAHNWTLVVSSDLYGEKTYTKPLTLTAGSWTQVTFNAGTADGSITITITIDDEIKEEIKIEATVDPTTDNNVVEGQN